MSVPPASTTTTNASSSLPPVAPPPPPYSPWLDRVKALLGPRGYDHSMRRSIQTIVIYEAKRCIQPRIGDLRPFQRKVALIDQAQALVQTLDFCLPHHKAEILWRTSTSRETVTPEICWKRYQLIQKELDRLAEQIKPFLHVETTTTEATPPQPHDPHEDNDNDEPEEEAHEAHNTATDDPHHHPLHATGGHDDDEHAAATTTVLEQRDHQQAVDLLEQHIFETSGDNQGKSNSGKLVPPNWGHAHNHVLLCFRLYYRGDALDPDFPDPVPPKHIVVPAVLPKDARQHHASGSNHHHTTTTLTIKNEADGSGGDASSLSGHKRAMATTTSGISATTGASASNNPSDERRRLLQEVRDHLDLLKEFEGVASEEELNERKKKLYAALPPAPPPFSAANNNNTKKQRQAKQDPESSSSSQQQQQQHQQAFL